MTFCLGINVREGLVGIADTRLTSGNECLTARKVSVYERDGGAMFIMTSGLRSVRDKALTYFEDALGQREEPFTRLYQAVNLFTDQVRRVASEDKAALLESGLAFDMKALIGGQMRGEDAHKLYLVYPEGNWVDTGSGTPYHVIGSTGYGKPILDRDADVQRLDAPCLQDWLPCLRLDEDQRGRRRFSHRRPCSTCRTPSGSWSIATRRRICSRSRTGGRSACA